MAQRDAAVAVYIFEGLWCAVAIEIVAGGAKHQLGHRNFAYDHGATRRFGSAIDAEVDALVDDIRIIVLNDQLDRELRIPLEKSRQQRNDEAARDRKRHREPH